MEKIIIQGIPFDAKSSFLKGCAEAPKVIRKVMNNGSSNMFSESGNKIYGEEIQDLGNFNISDYDNIYDITKSNILPGPYKAFTLGGDHSITYPIIKALAEIYPSFHVLHIDAHADLYDCYEGDKYSHACPFARIMEDEAVLSLTQIGIRTLNEHQRKQADKYDVKIIEMKNWDLNNVEINGPLYISLDMDAFDPAFAPGVSHHEPGGFSSREIIDLIQTINVDIIGADIVEYNPSRDYNYMTAALVVKLMKEIISKMMK